MQCLLGLLLTGTQRPEVRQRIESGFCRAGGTTASCSRTTRLSWNYRLAHIYSVFILYETRNIKEVNQMTALPSASRTPFTNPAAHPRLRVLRGGSSRGWCSWQRIPLWRWRCQWWWSWTGCLCRRSLGPGTSGHSICQCEGPLGGEGGRVWATGREKEKEMSASSLITRPESVFSVLYFPCYHGKYYATSIKSTC